MIRSLGLVALMSLELLLAGCGNDPSGISVPSTSPGNAVAHNTPRITLYWKPTRLHLNPGESNGKLATIWYSHNVVLFFNSYCKSKGVKMKLHAKGQRGRLYWKEYKVYASIPGPFSCPIEALDGNFDSVEANLEVRVST